ncbi:DNA-directed RNA polymerase subunit omega [Desulfarculales bacterium]
MQGGPKNDFGIKFDFVRKISQEPGVAPSPLGIKAKHLKLRKVIKVARVTVEDCLRQVDNRFSLVHLAAKRVRQLREGALPHMDVKNKEVVLALREVASGDVYPVSAEEAEVERAAAEERERVRIAQAMAEAQAAAALRLDEEEEEEDGDQCQDRG